MRLYSFLFSAVLIFSCLPVSADVLPPRIWEINDHLDATPDTYSRVDSYCTGKKPGDSCVITGSILAGGGDGLCNTAYSGSALDRDLSCVLQGAYSIRRDLPEPIPSWNYRSDKNPIMPIPADRFCKGKEVGSSCTVELNYRAMNELDEGVCTKSYDIVGYAHPNDPIRRDVILCIPRPVEATPRTYAPVSWWQRLFQ